MEQVMVTIKWRCENCQVAAMEGRGNGSELPVSRPFVPTSRISTEVGPRQCPVCGSYMNVWVMFDPLPIEGAGTTT